MIDITVLQGIWFVLIAVLMAGYFILDGFDLGIGVLYPFIGKDEEEKALLRRSGFTYRGNIRIEPEAERGHDPARQAFEKILK